MLKDVIISLQTVQNCDDAENRSTLDFTTDGHYTYDDNIGCVTYEESEVTGLPGTRTSLFIMPDQVIVDRDGSLTSRMVFKEGEEKKQESSRKTSTFALLTVPKPLTVWIRTNCG